MSNIKDFIWGGGVVKTAVAGEAITKGDDVGIAYTDGKVYKMSTAGKTMQFFGVADSSADAGAECKVNIVGAGLIKSIQRGSTTGSADITIQPVDTSKSIINVSFVSLGSASSSSSQEFHSSGQAYGYGYGYGYGKVGGKAEFKNSSTISITATDTNTTTAWEVIEYA